MVTATANGSPGAYEVTASVNGVNTPARFSLSNNGSQSIAIFDGDGQRATVGAAFATRLQALVLDANDAPVQGVVVTFTAPANGASATLSSATATTDANGVAAMTTTTANKIAGTYVVSATTAQAAGSADFTLTNDAGAAATITVKSGSGQTAAVGSAFAAPLVAEVKDTWGNVVPSATVTFSAPANGASASLVGSPATTDAQGLASADATASAAAGTYTVTASTSGVNTPASFSLTNTCTLNAHCPAQTPVCNAGTCVDLCVGVVCSALDQCHVAGSCNPATGQCGNPAAANGLGCNDNDPNTVSDVCTNGVCAGVDHCIGVVCSALDQCHVAGTCDHATGQCSNPAAANGFGCNDGNANTVSDVCTNGVCAGVDHCIGVVCSALDQCHVAGSCDHATGQCSNPRRRQRPRLQ